MSKYWFDYVKSCYDLIIEAEGQTAIILEHEVEAYLVHLMANNFQRTDIGSQAVALQIMQALQTRDKTRLLAAADECLLIHSYPLRQGRWPSPSYYHDMGVTAYAMAEHVMQRHFDISSKILSKLFQRSVNLH